MSLARTGFFGLFGLGEEGVGDEFPTLNNSESIKSKVVELGVWILLTSHDVTLRHNFPKASILVLFIFLRP